MIEKIFPNVDWEKMWEATVRSWGREGLSANVLRYGKGNGGCGGIHDDEVVQRMDASDDKPRGTWIIRCHGRLDTRSRDTQVL